MRKSRKRQVVPRSRKKVSDYYYYNNHHHYPYFSFVKSTAFLKLMQIWQGTLGEFYGILPQVLAAGFPRLLESPGYFFFKIPGPGKSLWSWKFLEIEV